MVPHVSSSKMRTNVIESVKLFPITPRTRTPPDLVVNMEGMRMVATSPSPLQTQVKENVQRERNNTSKENSISSSSSSSKKRQYSFEGHDDVENEEASLINMETASFASSSSSSSSYSRSLQVPEPFNKTARQAGAKSPHGSSTMMMTQQISRRRKENDDQSYTSSVVSPQQQQQQQQQQLMKHQHLSKEMVNTKLISPSELIKNDICEWVPEVIDDLTETNSPRSFLDIVLRAQSQNFGFKVSRAVGSLVQSQSEKLIMPHTKGGFSSKLCSDEMNKEYFERIQVDDAMSSQLKAHVVGVRLPIMFEAEGSVTIALYM
jgi:hypothetical protein